MYHIDFGGQKNNIHGKGLSGLLVCLGLLAGINILAQITKLFPYNFRIFLALQIFPNKPFFKLFPYNYRLKYSPLSS